MRNINTILDRHVTSQLECVDHIYLNAYIPILKLLGRLASFLVTHHEQPIPSLALLGRLTKAFLVAVERFAQENQIPIVHFRKGERKKGVVRPYFQQAPGWQGVVLIGVAQERATAFRGYSPRRGPKARALSP